MDPTTTDMVAKNREGFPIGKVIEQVLEKHNIPYIEAPVYGGFDVRIARAYHIKLPIKEKKKFFGILKEQIPTLNLEALTNEINQIYFPRFEPEVLQNRPDLAKPSILTDKVAGYILTSPRNQQTNDGFIDVAKIEVIGYI